MRDTKFYLGEAEFTKKSEIGMDIVSQIDEKNPIEWISDFVKSIPSGPGPWRGRSAGEIISDRYVTGCTDSGLVFVTLARIKGIPAAYVETLEECFLQNPTQDKIPGHIFADIYQNGLWIPYNPCHGKTQKDGKRYSWSADEPNRIYIEIARGLDFSQLYTDDNQTEPIELRTTDQIRDLIRNLKNYC